MFSYFGSKWNLAKRYGKPLYPIVVEPFAGSASYSLYWNVPKAILYDVHEEIFGIWSYLIKTSEKEILSLPLDFDTVDDLTICQEAKWLIGYWIKKASTTAGKSRTAWARQYRYHQDCKVWGEKARERIAGQLKSIKNWEVYQESYQDCPDIEGTWFIDPPYQVTGYRYRHSKIDYDHLSDFCFSRKGQVFVCENEGAKWLDFSFLYSSRGTFGHKRTGVSKEVYWTNRKEN
jgi:site-specific DNA-adenine methylase